MLKIIEKTKIWFAISIIIIGIGLVNWGVKGLNYGIDFKGGTLVQVDMKKDFDKNEVQKIVKKYASDAQTNKAFVEKTVELEIRSNSITEDKANEMIKEIKESYKGAEIKSQETIGASIGKELKTKAFYAIIIATIAMLAYVAFRFEFKFGIAAILALVHDILITIGIYAIFQIPVNSSFIAAVLTIVGYSINDTIVIFDRIRENVKKMRNKDIVEIADVSITETMTRSINTVLTTLLTIVAVNIMVPAVREFSFPLIVGILSGCYSSIFIASPLWVVLKKNSKIKSKNSLV